MGRHISLNGQICSGCKVDLPLEAFGKDKRAPSGIARVCLTCNRERMRAWTLRNPGASKQRDIDRDYRPARNQRQREDYARKHPAVVVLRTARLFQEEVLLEAVQWVEANPGNTYRKIAMEAGLSQYLWTKIRHLFDKTITPSEPGRYGKPRKITWSRNSEPYSVKKIPNTTHIPRGATL
jgi:hypothetical protein